MSSPVLHINWRIVQKTFYKQERKKEKKSQAQYRKTKMYMVAPFVADPTCRNFTVRQSLPTYKPPLFASITFEQTVQFKTPSGFWMS